MSIGLQISVSNAYGQYGFPTTGTVTIKLHPTPQRTSGVYARITSGIRSVEPVGPVEEYNSVYARNRGTNFDGYGDEYLPLEQAYALPTSAMNGVSFPDVLANGVALVSRYAYLEFGVIGSEPVRRISLEGMVFGNGLAFVLELAVYQPPGSQAPIAVVGDLSRPLNWNYSFDCPMSFIPDGYSSPRSYASYSIEWPEQNESDAYTFVPYRGPAPTVRFRTPVVKTYPNQAFRRSVEFDQGPCIYGKSRAWASDWLAPPGKPANNAAIRRPTTIAFAPAAITDEHRKAQTVGMFGWPVTASQNHWPMLGEQYDDAITIRFTHPTRPDFSLGLQKYGFELGKEDFEGNTLAANTATTRMVDINEHIHNTGFLPKDESAYVVATLASAQEFIDRIALDGSWPNVLISGVSNFAPGYALASEAEAIIAARQAAMEAGDPGHFLGQIEQDIFIIHWRGHCGFRFQPQTESRPVPVVSHGTVTSGGMSLHAQGGQPHVPVWKDNVIVKGALQSITKSVDVRKRLWYYSGWQYQPADPRFYVGPPRVFLYPTSYTSVVIDDGQTTRVTDESISFEAALTQQQIDTLRQNGSVTLPASTWTSSPWKGTVSSTGLERGSSYAGNYPRLYGPDPDREWSIELTLS